ncbi:hypothetical protein Tco_0798991 [Tanacetum coccineum]
MAYESSTPTTTYVTVESNVNLSVGRVDTSTNTITFILSYSSKPLSFELGNFSTITGLNYNENYDALPPMETVKAALETLGLADEKNLQFTPYELINKSSLRIEEYLITYLMREREGFPAALAVLITGASQNRQLGMSEPAR